MPSQCSPYCGAITVDKICARVGPAPRARDQQRTSGQKNLNGNQSTRSLMRASGNGRASTCVLQLRINNHGATPMRTLLAACGFAILWAAPSAAVPLTGSTPQTENITTKVATFVCSRDEHGWHYMRGDRRVTCRPARPEGRFWAWHCDGPRCGWWHRNERRWYD
jgi:hypothetical protein